MHLLLLVHLLLLLLVRLQLLPERRQLVVLVGVRGRVGRGQPQLMHERRGRRRGAAGWCHRRLLGAEPARRGQDELTQLAPWRAAVANDQRCQRPSCLASSGCCSCSCCSCSCCSCSRACARLRLRLRRLRLRQRRAALLSRVRASEAGPSHGTSKGPCAVAGWVGDGANAREVSKSVSDR